jgi:hypothetical protein
VDIQAIEEAGELAVLVFSRIATGQARGLCAMRLQPSSDCWAYKDT